MADGAPAQSRNSRAVEPGTIARSADAAMISNINFAPCWARLSCRAACAADRSCWRRPYPPAPPRSIRCRSGATMRCTALAATRSRGSTASYIEVCPGGPVSSVRPGSSALESAPALFRPSANIARSTPGDPRSANLSRYPATSTRLACQLAQPPGAQFIGSFWPSVSRMDVALFQHFAGGS
jgi:hypothetical protein